ncbi:uncharacterized protein LOC144119664 [Amblyomma americanum]
MCGSIYSTLFNNDGSDDQTSQANVSRSKLSELPSSVSAVPNVGYEHCASGTSTKSRVGYVHSPGHLFECERLPRIRKRCFLVHGLLKGYNLLKNLHPIHPFLASREDLCLFHSADYVDFLESCEAAEDLDGEDICVLVIQSWVLPLRLLGGGGYEAANCARCWTAVTAALLGQELDDDIPEHRFLMAYGPGYELSMEPGFRRDLNDAQYVDGILQEVMKHVSLFGRS